MANYPIKVLQDEDKKPFVPLTSTLCIKDSNGKTLEERLKEKIGPANLFGGSNINVRTEGYNCYIDLDLPASLNIINNLTTNQSGEGALDAYQGKILKESIPILVNSLDSTDATKALSANQGKILLDKINTISLTPGPKGKEGNSFILLNSSRNRVWSWATFLEYAKEGHQETWVDITNTEELKPGDTWALEITISDRNNSKALIIGEIISTTSSTIVGVSKSYLAGPVGAQGDRGEKGDTGSRGPAGPTGAAAVVESNSNSRGHWIKFNDGTMVQYGSTMVECDLYQDRGGKYYGYLADPGTFPVSFAAVPICYMWPRTTGNVFVLQQYDPSTMNASHLPGCYPWSYSSGLQKFNIAFLAVGRWK